MEKNKGSIPSYSLFDITVEWPKTTQIAAILPSDGTYNVYMYLSFSSNESLTFSTYSRERKHSRSHYKKFENLHQITGYIKC